MKTFIDEDFLLHSDAAKKLFHDHAKDQPIFDYHCHLPPRQIAENHRFEDLADLWLAGDHYKWRAMRANGIPEEFCTGNAKPYEKFLAFARTVPHTLRNPLYHWTHLELLRFFGIDELLDESSAEGIWHQANELLAGPGFGARELMERSLVRVACTTDDPTDDLSSHLAMKEVDGPRVFPTFRPDKAFGVDEPASFRDWVAALERVSGIGCDKFSGFLEALKERHEAFHNLGCRLSDHGLNTCPGKYASEKKAKKIYADAMQGEAAEPADKEKFSGFLMVYFGMLDAERGWTKQLHLGALRGNNSRKKAELGPDTGFDSIGDWLQAENLAKFLDTLDQESALPKMVLYNLNPSQNYVFATMAGNFQEGPGAGKIQFGSGWWFLDQKDGMEWQIDALSNLGLLSRFVGMLTDSRSFLSYTRHEYFRRILCNKIGREIEDREMPRDFALIGNMIERICYGNAESFFGLT